MLSTRTQETGRRHHKHQIKIYPPLAESFLVLIILAAYSCPVVIFIHLLTTENAPLETKTRQSVSPTETPHYHYQLTGSTEGRDVGRI